MSKRGSGQIVNVASLAGLIGYPGNAPYATTKFGVVGLSSTLRVEGIDLGIKVNAVCPGYVDTNIFNASPTINVDKEKAIKNISYKLMDSSKAAKIILKGVEQNKAVIAFPSYARILWRMYRLYQNLLKPLGLQTIRKLRKVRLTS
jgi:short-subunit dehydrogenase